MSGLRVRVHVPQTGRAAGRYLVLVALRDTSEQDVEHTVVAERRTEMRPGVVTEIDMPVSAATLDARNRYTLWVHASAGDVERIAPGDFITTAAEPVTLSDVEENRRIDVTLRRI